MICNLIDADQNISSNDRHVMETGVSQNKLSKISLASIKKKKKPKKSISLENKEISNPCQLLNELHSNLVYCYEASAEDSTKIPKYVCRVNVNGIVYAEAAMSKKEAKRRCADQILSDLYADRYKKSDDIERKKMTERSLKLLSFDSIKSKSASQLLNELDRTVAQSSKYEANETPNRHKTFSCTLKVNGTDVHAIGKSKKEAKNEAAKVAIKTMFNIDINNILMEQEKMKTVPSDIFFSSN
jgi:dsRNA-specific ribonuclease